MANDPAFLFYPGDYLRDTQCLSEPAQTAYDRIMCEHMRNICISQEQLNFFTKRLTPDQKSEVLMVLTKVSGGYQIAWVAESIQKRRKYSDSRRKNREGKPKKKETYVPHMENENVIEIVNKDKGVQGEKDLNWFVSCLDEIFIENMKAIHKGKNIEQATKEAFAHMAADENRLRAADQSDVRRLVNTWLSNQKVQKNGKANGNYYDKDKLARLIEAKYGSTRAEEQTSGYSPPDGQPAPYSQDVSDTQL